jgi:hypothetical protein
MTSFVRTFALAAAAALALTFAASASACECMKQQAGDTAAAKDQKAGKTAAAKCACSEHKDHACKGGDCKCGSHCGKHEEGAKPEKKADASSIGAGGVLLAEGCHCDKDGKNCTCKKGACKCASCAAPKPEKRA